MKASARIKEKRANRFSPPDLFTDSEQCSFAVHPCTAHYRIFALQKCAAVLQRYDTVIDNLKAEADGELPEVFGGQGNRSKSAVHVCGRRSLYGTGWCKISIQIRPCLPKKIVKFFVSLLHLFCKYCITTERVVFARKRVL